MYFIMKLLKLINSNIENKNLISNKYDYLNKIKYIYAIGKNSETLKINDKFPLAGILDDTSKDSMWNNIPLVNINSINKNSIVFNCSTSISPVDTYNYLVKSGIKNIVNLHELLGNGIIQPPDFMAQMNYELNKNIDEIEYIFNSLHDEESKNIFFDIICYRLTANISYMQKYRVRFQDQYFENFMHYDKEIFVDAGGYDGDTTENFIFKYPNYKKIFLFEPLLKNINSAKKRLLNFPRIQYFQIGLSDKTDVLQFNPANSASSISENGSESIIVDRLDNIIKEPITFIKMDIEGWELNALEGSKELIISNYPKLAIAVYHNSADFRKIFYFIKSLKKDYKVYIRHYTQGWSESIMYFVPHNF